MCLAFFCTACTSTDVVNGAPSSVNKSEYAKYTYYNEKTAKKQIEAAKEIADFVIVSMHRGDEDEFDADSSQKEIARKLAELGANAIIGHHPHVVQTIEGIETEKRFAFILSVIFCQRCCTQEIWRE